MEEAKSHQSVDWYQYFKSIQSECPWSYSAYCKGSIDIVVYQGEKLPLGDFSARIYLVNAPEQTVIALAQGFDYEDREYEWFYSYPGYGEYATPVSVLIQQSRAQLQDIRSRQ